MFDMDDTLIKTWQTKWAHSKLVAKKYYNQDLTDETLHKHWGKSFDVMVGELFQHAAPLGEIRENYFRHDHEFLKPAHDEAVDLVQALLDAGIAVGVVTSMTTDIAYKDMRDNDFPLERFAIIQGCDLTPVHKPDPHVFDPALAALKKQGITTDIVYVGDALSDFYAARDAGLEFIAVTTGLVDKATFQKAGAMAIVASLAQVRRLLLPA